MVSVSGLKPEIEPRLDAGLYATPGVVHAAPVEAKFQVAVVSLIGRLRTRGFGLLEVQYLTDHLKQFGTIEISHRAYANRLKKALKLDAEFGAQPAPGGEALE